MMTKVTGWVRVLNNNSVELLLFCEKFHRFGNQNIFITRMLAINVAIPNLKIARLVQF